MAKISEYIRRVPRIIRISALLAALPVIAVFLRDTSQFVKVCSELWDKRHSTFCEEYKEARYPDEISRSFSKGSFHEFNIPPSVSLWDGEYPSDLASVMVSSCKRMENLVDVITGVKQPETTNVYFIHAPYGAGKTPLMEYFKRKSSYAYINLTEISDDVRKGISKIASKTPDLFINNQQISWLPYVNSEVLAQHEGMEEYLNFITNKNNDYTKGVLIDSIDELHPRSATTILDLVVTWADSHPEQIAVVAGRGEAFRDFAIGSELQNINYIRIPNIYVGDNRTLNWYVNSYVQYVNRSRTVAKVGPRFNSGVADDVRRLVDSRDFAKHYLYAGSLANFLIENTRYVNESPERLEALMFQTLIERNKRTHNRPDRNDLPEVWNAYKSSLVQIARKYKPDPETGSFAVGPEDTVCFKQGENIIQSNVASILRLSGLIDIDPINVRYLEVRFWPRNLHRFLVRGIVE